MPTRELTPPTTQPDGALPPKDPYKNLKDGIEQSFATWFLTPIENQLTFQWKNDQISAEAVIIAALDKSKLAFAQETSGWREKADIIVNTAKLNSAKKKYNTAYVVVGDWEDPLVANNIWQATTPILNSNNDLNLQVASMTTQNDSLDTDTTFKKLFMEKPIREPDLPFVNVITINNSQNAKGAPELGDWMALITALDILSKEGEINSIVLHLDYDLREWADSIMFHTMNPAHFQTAQAISSQFQDVALIDKANNCLPLISHVMHFLADQKIHIAINSSINEGVKTLSDNPNDENIVNFFVHSISDTNTVTTSWNVSTKKAVQTAFADILK